MHIIAHSIKPNQRKSKKETINNSEKRTAILKTKTIDNATKPLLHLKMTAVQQEYDLSQFSDLLADDFVPSQYANSLLLSTNNLYVSQLNSLQESITNDIIGNSSNNVDPENELDLVTATKKVLFNIQEAQSKIAKISSTHYDSLINEFEKIEYFQSSFNSLQGSIVQLNESMAVLKTDFLQNYEACSKIINRLQNIHSTFSLINDLILFLDGLRRFNNSFKTIQFSTTAELEDSSYSSSIPQETIDSVNKNLTKTANNFYLLNKILHGTAYHNQKNISSSNGTSETGANGTATKIKTDTTSNSPTLNASFKQLKIVKDFNTMYKIDKIDRINNYCLDLLKSDTFVELTVHQPIIASPSPSNLIVSVLITLMIFNTKDSLIEILNRYYKHEVSYCTNLLKKILISPRHFDHSMQRISLKSKKILAVAKVLSSLKLLSYDTALLNGNPFIDLVIVHDNNANINSKYENNSDNHNQSHGDHSKSNISNDNNKNSNLTLNTFVLKNLSISINNRSLFTNFYKDISLQFEDLIAKTLFKGGPVAKNLKANYASINASITKRVVECDCDYYHVNEKSLEVLMMRNSIRKLQGPK